MTRGFTPPATAPPCRRWAALPLLSLLLTVLPSPLASGAPQAAVNIPARLGPALHALSSGRIEDAVRAAVSLLPTEIPGSTAPHLAVPATVPPVLAGPVGALMAAVEQASGLARGAVRASLGDLDRAVPAVLGPSPSDPLGALTLRSADGRERIARQARRVSRRIDRGRLAAAALVIARAIDRSLAEMKGSFGATISTVPATGCDVVDLPSLCIGGTGPNRYEEDETLLIDLGGDDIYVNSAGGADPLGNGLAVSVAVDLSGNDRYEATLPTASGATLAQGSAVLGAVGMLVDAAGDDTYAATWTRTPGAGGFHADHAQAQGFALAGAGILADLGGSDTYRVENSAPAPDPDDLEGGVTLDQGALGMGVAAFGGLGVLLDAGTSDDAYLLASRPTPSTNEKGVLSPGIAGAQGFGFGGGGGAALFLDGGGADRMEIVSEVAPVDPENEAPLVGEAIAASRGFGASSLGGAGVTVTGPGPTTRIARGLLGAPWAKPKYIGIWTYASVQGFGYAEQEAFAAMVDQGGDDVYDAEAVSDAARRTSPGDGSVPLQGLAAKGGPASVVGMGASTAGFAYLGDLGGDDLYRAAASSSIAAAAHDPGTTTDGAVASTTGGMAYVAAHGFGGGVFGLLQPDGATGVLEDAAGDDVYESTVRARASALATSGLEGGLTRADAVAGDAASWSQAVGDVRARGELRDLGGTDVYRSTASSEARANPPHSESPGTVHSSVQGSVAQGGSALLLDVDGGANDVFSAQPPDPPCEGTRGVALWRDCGAAFGIGSNDGGVIPETPAPARLTPVASASSPAVERGGTLPCRPGSALVLTADYGCAGLPREGSAVSGAQDVLPCPDPWEDHCEEWVARYNGTGAGGQGEDNGFAVALSPDGNTVFTAGATSAATGFDFLVMAHDATTGVQRWVSTYDGPDPDGGFSDVATALAVDPDGHRVYATGQLAGPTGGDYGTLAYDAATGDRLWVASYEGPAGEQDVAWSVSTDGRRVFVTGQSGPFNRQEWATIAYDDATGEELWTTTYDGPKCAESAPADQVDIPYWMAADPGDRSDPDDTRVFVTGLSSGCETSWDSATIAYNGDTGEPLWSARYHAGEWVDFSTSMALSPDGRTVYVTGPSVGLLNEDYATIAFEATTGRQLWLSRYSGDEEGLDRAYSVTVSPDGQRVFVTGQSDGHELDEGIGYATVAYDAHTGVELWSRRYDGPGVYPVASDVGYSVTVGSDSSRVFVTGYSSGVGGSSVGTVAYDAATGEQLWVGRYGGPDLGNTGIAVVVHPLEPLVYVTGAAYEPGSGLEAVTLAYRQ